MEAKYGKLWETKKESDLDKYHELRKIKPLENGLKNMIFSAGQAVLDQVKQKLETK